MSDNRKPKQAAHAPRTAAKPLSRREEDAIRAAFDEADEDGSGELDVEEIGEMLRKMGRVLSQRELEGAMAEMDLDGSGDVDFPEFRAWYLDQKLGTNAKFAAMVSEKNRTRFNADGLPPKWRGPKWVAERAAAVEMAELAEKDDGGAQGGVEGRRLKALFAEFDLDGSGELDREEIAALTEKMGTRFNDEELDEAMQDMDADGSGEVDFEEFQAWFEASKASGSNFSKMISEAARLRWNDEGLPRKWKGPQWLGGYTSNEAPPRREGRPRSPGSDSSAGSAAGPATAAAADTPATRQKAVRDWALGKLAFDPALEERQGGIPASVLRSAFAKESRRPTTAADRWFGRGLIDAANADARGRRIVHGAPFGATASTVHARYERYAGGVAETVYCARWRGAAPLMGGAQLPPPHPFKLRAVLGF